MAGNRHAAGVAAVTAALAAWADDVRTAEVRRVQRRLRGLTDTEREIVDDVTTSLVASLFQGPITRLSAASEPDGARYAEVVRQVFALDEHL